MAKFSIATNFDPTFLEGIGRLNEKYPFSKVSEVYGSLPISLTGSGRSPVGLPNVSVHDLAEHIKYAHGFDLEFNYLMNSPRVGDFDDAELGKRLHHFIDYLREIEVDSITVSDESLVKYMREKFPDFPVHVSLIAGIDTLKEAKRFSDLGVKVLTLNPHTINRSIKRIKEIANAVNCEVRLYANVSCLQDCPKRSEHYSWVGSQSNKALTDNLIDKDKQADLDRGKRAEADYFILWCEKRYMERPVELLQSPFIRPEGLGLYEEIGVDSFKLSDRREPTSALVRLLEAYMGGEYQDNLFSLLFREDRKWTNAVRDIIEVESLGHTAIFIDNNKLTELDFDRKVLTLSGEELEKFYQSATKAAVSGVSDPRTRNFHVKLHSIRK